MAASKEVSAQRLTQERDYDERQRRDREAYRLQMEREKRQTRTCRTNAQGVETCSGTPR